jgi:excisionase family DNA binding protein
MPRRKKPTTTSKAVRTPAVPLSNDQQLLTVPQAAALLGVKPSWVYTRAKTAEFPAVFIGRYLRVERAGLGLWIARQREQQRSGRAT